MLVSRRVCVDQGAIRGIIQRLVMWVLSLLHACLEEDECMIIHDYLQDIIQMKRVGKIKGWSRLSQEWIMLIKTKSRVNQVDQLTKHRRCTKRDQVIPWYGTCRWACVKRKISYNPWKGWHQVVIVIMIAVCKFKWSITKRSSAWILPSIVVSMDLWRCAEESLTHSGLWGAII